MTTFKRHLVTSALPYTNGPVHIGHLAGVYIASDIYVRYLRARYGRENVLHVCGSDEHGVPITLKAKKEGISPQDVVDKYHGIIKKSFEDFGIDFDIYHRTSDPVHHETAKEFFTTLYEKGVFVEKESEQYYDEKNNEFLADRYIKGTCPNCKHENAYGDQCENCGSSLSPMELINPTSAISGEVPILKKTKHFYIPLDKMQEEWLNDWIIEGKGQTEDWKKSVLGQCKSWLKQGLHPRAVTRDLSWGVEVPVAGYKDKVMYVWFDAPIGYISATKAWAAENGKNWKDYWHSNDTKLVHFLGKDNIVFHCIIFPAMLKAEGNYILPTNVPANEFMNMEGDKMSTSRNWTVWLHEYLDEFPDKQDVLRYVLIDKMPESKDSDFSWKDFQAKNNNELVANLGNYINRVLVLTHKYYDGKVQAAQKLEKVDQDLLNAIQESYVKIGEYIEKYEFRAALQKFMALSAQGNKYLADLEPWKLIKTDVERTGTILNIAIQLVAHLGQLSKALLPFTSTKILGLLAITSQDKWPDEYKTLLKEGHTIEPSALLFEKIEDEVIQKQLDRLEKIKADQVATEPQFVPVKSEIQFDDFTKLDLRTGTILKASKVPKADKLLQFEVDLGFEKRTILSGIAEQFDPADLIGHQVCVVVNLAPRKIRGVLSQGMILLAEDENGKLEFVKAPVSMPNGSGVN
ncbi:UNVERIFIED_CONTAM: hypothetical protein GTU68_041380 [Idotea baltica]|nr:hypothetical protein [Idotea baltica]